MRDNKRSLKYRHRGVLCIYLAAVYALETYDLHTISDFQLQLCVQLAQSLLCFITAIWF